jgi:2,4-dienoyl-CoA reductase-like NADH-dependent reductase (Old Yellow Enzyme family)
MVAHRLFQPAGAEAYFLPFARALKPCLKRAPLILVGGIRTTDIMARIIGNGDADFISMSRPFIREPDLPNQIRLGRRGLVDCVSCNICVVHEGLAPLRCWRLDKRDLLKHLAFEIGNAFGVRR